MIDSQGRIWGKISILDLGAALVIILVIIGIFVFPGTSGTTINQTTEPVAVDILVRGLVLKDPEALKNQAAKKLEIIVRNQPYGGVKLE